MYRTTLQGILLASSILAGVGTAMAADVTLNIESWRNDDLQIWQEKIIPAFEAKHPGIKVTVLAERADRIQRRAQRQARRGLRRRSRRLPAVRHVARTVQQGQARRSDGPRRHEELLRGRQSPRGVTDDGKKTFCVPMASVIHGFIYNKEAFEKAGVEVPKTVDQFFAVLETRSRPTGTYIPMAMGTKDMWEAATMGYQNIGPTYWKGEEGRKALIAGKAEASPTSRGSSPIACSPSGSPISATASRPRPIPTARTSSRSAAPPSTRPARGRSRCSTPPASSSAPSRRRSRKTGIPATSPTTTTSRMGLNAASEVQGRGQGLPRVGGLARVRLDLRQRAAGLLQPELDGRSR